MLKKQKLIENMELCQNNSSFCSNSSHSILEDLSNNLTAIITTTTILPYYLLPINSSSNDTVKVITLFSDRQHYYFIYSILVAIGVLVCILRSSTFYTIAIKSSRKLHKIMFDSLMSTSVRFFDLNPIGRIMNRFSKDIAQLDDIVPENMSDFLEVFMLVISSLAITVWIIPWIIIPLIPLGFLFLWMRRYYLKASLEIKRIDGITRSPLFIHINNTIGGMSTIRANRNQDILSKEFSAHSDYNTRAYAAYLYANRWFAIRLDLIYTVYTYIAVFSCILLKDYMGIDSGQVGVMLVYLSTLSSLFQWCVRQSSEVENQMTAVERILEYTELPSEPLDEGEMKPPNDKWPQRGEIRFEDVNFKYDANLPNALNELTFEIKPGEKIGIVGRTGAGKSSLIQTLFRMGALEGKIFVDNVDISKLSLHDLRSKISIIPVIN
jgi:ATP-binding cassette, subfamily C (CFTR/MRP), member 4